MAFTPSIALRSRLAPNLERVVANRRASAFLAGAGPRRRERSSAPRCRSPRPRAWLAVRASCRLARGAAAGATALAPGDRSPLCRGRRRARRRGGARRLKSQQFTRASPVRSEFVTKNRNLRRTLDHGTDIATSAAWAAYQPRGPALPLDRLGRSPGSASSARSACRSARRRREEVYELAKRRGMDFVTITDHDTIDGVLQIADRPDVFVSEELTARFRGEPPGGARPLLGITAEDHEWLQAHGVRRRSLRRIHARARRSRRRSRTPTTRSRRRSRAATGAGSPSCSTSGRFATAHARRSSTGPRPPTSRRATGSASRAATTTPATDIGRTFTETPHAATPAEFLAHLREGNVRRARRAGQRGKVGARRDRPRRPLAPGARGRRRSAARPGAGDGTDEPAAQRGRRPRGRRASSTSSRRTPAACCAAGSSPWASATSTRRG